MKDKLFNLLSESCSDEHVLAQYFTTDLDSGLQSVKKKPRYVDICERLENQPWAMKAISQRLVSLKRTKNLHN